MTHYRFENMAVDYYRTDFRSKHHYDNSSGTTCHFVARMLAGSGRLVGEDFELTLEAGDLFYIPMGLCYHSYWEGERMVWDSLGFTELPGELTYPLQKRRSSSDIDELFERLSRSDGSDALTLGLIYTLIGTVLAGMKSDSSPHNSLVERASRLMRENPKLPIPEIARLCQVSESGLYAAFRAAGTTPVKARLESQVQSAVTLLQATDLTVEAIAECCGFGSVIYFYRVLKRVTGKSSRELRNRGVM